MEAKETATERAHLNFAYAVMDEKQYKDAYVKYYDKENDVVKDAICAVWNSWRDLLIEEMKRSMVDEIKKIKAGEKTLDIQNCPLCWSDDKSDLAISNLIIHDPDHYHRVITLWEIESDFRRDAWAKTIVNVWTEMMNNIKKGV